jgi:8-oxo-dGTP diphosphatase
MRDMTLCFLLRGTPPREILLGYKKRGFGAGKVAGIGGRVESGESILTAACRELYEETGISAHEPDLQSMGAIAFRFPNQPTWNQVVHVFIATRWTGEPSESDEMLPTWYPIDAVPFEQMWDDSRYWLPQILAGQPLQAQITFAEDNATVCDSQLTPSG